MKLRFWNGLKCVPFGHLESLFRSFLVFHVKVGTFVVWFMVGRWIWMELSSEIGACFVCFEHFDHLDIILVCLCF